MSVHREGLELSDESLEAGITPDPGDPYPRPEAPALIAADPLVIDDDVPTVQSRPALPVLDDPNRSPNPAVCPFLRRQDGGSLVAPVAFAADGQTCVAIGSPRGQSQQQQELVCLRSAHTDCPRYQRGAMVAAPSAGRTRSGPAIPRATLAALLILVLSAGISFGFVVQRGGITMPVVGGSPSPTSVAAIDTESPAASDEAMATDEVIPGDSLEPVESGLGTGSSSLEPSLSPSPEPTPEPSVAPTPEPTIAPSPKPTPKPTPKTTAKPTSTRYKLLTPCPDKENCWIYRVRSGDNLYSIANYFGHPLKTIYAWNPRYPKASLRAGDLIRMPPPTR